MPCASRCCVRVGELVCVDSVTLRSLLQVKYFVAEETDDAGAAEAASAAAAVGPVSPSEDGDDAMGGLAFSKFAEAGGHASKHEAVLRERYDSCGRLVFN